jgi:hypothetical protein
VRLEAGRRRRGGKRRLKTEPEALIEELAKKFDDIELARVFADWLQQQGHPCGELAVVQLARLEKDSDELASREYDLIWNHANKYLSSVLARDHVTEYAWQRGVLDTITFHHHGGEEHLPAALRKLATDPSGRLVRRVEIQAVQFDGAGDLESTIAELASLAPRFPRLAELALVEGMNLGNPWIDGPIRVGDVTPLYAAYPRLEVFELGGKDYALGDLDLPALKKLAMQELSPTDVATIARAELPVIEELDLFFGRWRVDGIDAVFRPLFDRVMPTLATIAIASEIPTVMQYFVRALPQAALSRHARVLAFRRGGLDMDCVGQLVAWAPRLRGLERLEVNGRGLTTEGRRLLERTFGRSLLIR